MKRAVLMGAVAAALMSVGLSAQGRNFSGTWTMDSEKTTAANAGLASAGAAGGRGGGGGGVARSGGGGDAGATAVMVAGGGGGRGGGGAAAGGGGMRSGGAGVAPGMSLTVDNNSFTLAQGQTRRRTSSTVRDRRRKPESQDQRQVDVARRQDRHRNHR